MDKKGNIIDFFAKPIHRVPIQEVFQPSHLKRSASIVNINRSEVNTSRHNSSNLRSSAGDLSDRAYRHSVQPSNKIKLKPISQEELQHIIDKHKEKLEKDSSAGVLVLKMNNNEDKPKSKAGSEKSHGKNLKSEGTDDKQKSETNTQERADNKTGDNAEEKAGEKAEEQVKTEVKPEGNGPFVTQN